MRFWKNVITAPAKPFSRALRHEANYYRPFLQAGQITAARARGILAGNPAPRPGQGRRARPLRISRQDGWCYALVTAGMCGFCAYQALSGDPAALELAPIALVPGTLAYAGLRRSKH